MRKLFFWFLPILGVLKFNLDGAAKGKQVRLALEECFTLVMVAVALFSKHVE